MYLTRRDNNFFNDFFRAPFWMGEEPQEHPAHLMKTDIKEKDDAYEIDVELPGYDKENIKAEIKEGYLTITAAKNQEKEEKDAEGKFIRRERFTGSVKRSYYVGDQVDENTIKAAFKDGILSVELPKIPEPEPEQPKLIEIA